MGQACFPVCPDLVNCNEQLRQDQAGDLTAARHEAALGNCGLESGQLSKRK